MILAAGNDDGEVDIIVEDGKEFSSTSKLAHNSGITSLDWGLSPYPGLLDNPSAEIINTQTLKLVTGGRDNKVKVWIYDGILKNEIEWNIGVNVNDVAFANNAGLPYEMLACCAEDCTVRIWKKFKTMWEEPILLKLKVPGKKLSWSLLGNYLSVSDIDNMVYLYEERSPNKWELHLNP